MAGEELLTLEELTEFLNIAVDQETVEAIRLQVIDEFERETNRVGRPFQGPESNREEVKDGTGDCELWLDYPPSVITSITLGRGATPDETLDPTDTEVISWKVGDRRLVRLDGGSFGCYRSPNYVTVVYNAGDDRPLDAALAVKRKAAAVWRESNRPQATGERAMDDTEDLPLADDVNVDWDKAVAAHRVPAL